MNKKPIILMVAIIAIIAVITVIVVHENDKVSKASATGNNMDESQVEETPTPEPSEEPTATTTATPSTKPSAKLTTKPTTKYYIKVNTTANTVTVYEKDSNGEYTKPVKAMICSTGDVTPKNSTYKIQKKYTRNGNGWQTLFGHGPYEYVYGQYCQWITGDILFHSVPYYKYDDKTSLEWYEYNKLGTTCSQGCIRLVCSDAKWLYDNCPVGTPVEFYGSEDPGPLGKPSFQYISEDNPNRGWDPTDPDPANPWKTENK